MKAQLEVIRIKFQFHYGSIKSRKHITNLVGTDRFQFHNGSIKRAKINEYLAEKQEVSIPQWFD